MRRIDMAGKKYGHWVVLSRAYSHKGKAHWKCRCICGTVRVVVGQNIRNGMSVSCGCVKPNRLPKGQAAFNELYSEYKRNAKKRGLEFSLTEGEFKELTQENCIYCGEIPAQAIGKCRENCNGVFVYNGVDRLQNDKGYTVSNCVACCGRCNRMKREMSYLEFLQHIRKIASQSWFESMFENTHMRRLN